jgi:DNA (cytosine-5)-methyltransferase 1
LGDITNINGAEINPVWVVTGGSPCQDLSIAGKRAGLAGARSGLFMEQVRIVKEMRAEDKRNGRTGNMVRPRYLVWENVTGAYSSNGGRDFHAVLEEIARIAEPGFSLSGLPEKWKWTKAGAIDGDGWSIAWRTHDAKDWGKTIRDSRTGNVIRLGTPQRRRRISVVADFGGESAAQIQFERESVSWHPAESGAAGEGPAGASESGADETGQCLTAWDRQSKRIFGTDGEAPTLQGGIGGGVNNPAIFRMATQQGGAELRIDDRAPTLNAECGGNKPAVVALDMTHACDVIRECGEQSPSLQARMGTGGNQIPLTYQMQGFGDYRAGEVASSCKQRDFKDSTDLAITNMVVRRLTPLECTRLQGFPDGWTDIGDWVKTDKRGREIKAKGSADSPRYKALGNSIALPFWDWMLRRMARYLPEGATLGSLFDGIAGFPLIWERIHGKGTARWASEIEPFPIAVTKKHFPEEE